MSKHTFIATAVSVRKIRADETDRLPVNNLDGNGLSLLDLFYAFVAQLIAEDGFAHQKSQLVITPTEVQPAGRTVLFTHDSGYYGSKGGLRRIDGSKSHDIEEDEAPTLPKLGLMVVPVIGEFAVCLEHRIGNSALPKPFWAEFRRRVRAHHGLLVDISRAADGAAWEKFLDEAEKVLQVTYVDIPDDIADGRISHSQVGVRRYVAQRPDGVDSFPLRLLDLIRSREARERRQAAEMVLLPKDFGTASEVSVTVQVGGVPKTVVIDGDRWPAFVYKISGNPKSMPDSQVFASDARDVALDLLENKLDCQMGQNWREEVWSEERLDGRLDRKEGDDDDDVDPDGPAD